ncbi:MAG: NADH-quinone oxidoreductase subunit H [Planctomycetes bacterium]|nr:NADH-quinone oxidoreductase subunit H [Planctomycetota bacterium]
MQAVVSIIHWLVALALAPLLLGIIGRTKAFFAGRTGSPFLQPYHDLRKLLGKGAVYSHTTTWVFRAAPMVGLGAVFVASGMVPFGGSPAVIEFPADLILVVYLLGLLRFATVLGALDTGSSFEGMGASREVQFSALAEPVLLLALATLGRQTGSYSLSTIFVDIAEHLSIHAGPAMLMGAVALLVVFLVENARIPVDDPNTHLELTMIHEVMVLDYSGPDFAFVLYGAALKLWVLGALLVGLVIPVHVGIRLIDSLLFVLGMFALAFLVGVIESCMARLRLLRVPQMLIAAGAFAIFALVLVLRQT